MTRRLVAAALLIALAVSAGIDADLALEHPERQNGRYVATEHGEVVRVFTKAQYEEAVMAEMRVVALIIGAVALIALPVIATARQP